MRTRRDFTSIYDYRRYQAAKRTKASADPKPRTVSYSAMRKAAEELKEETKTARTRGCKGCGKKKTAKTSAPPTKAPRARKPRTPVKSEV